MIFSYWNTNVLHKSQEKTQNTTCSAATERFSITSKSDLFFKNQQKNLEQKY